MSNGNMSERRRGCDSEGRRGWDIVPRTNWTDMLYAKRCLVQKELVSLAKKPENERPRFLSRISLAMYVLGVLNKLLRSGDSEQILSASRFLGILNNRYFTKTKYTDILNAYSAMASKMPRQSELFASAPDKAIAKYNSYVQRRITEISEYLKSEAAKHTDLKG
jgi:hypothetical protein